MVDVNTYTMQLVAIINLAELRPLDPMSANPPYVVNVLAKHSATNRVEVLVLAKNTGGITQFHNDFPNAGIVAGDGTPDSHEEWLMLAFPKSIQQSTSPVEIFKRGLSKAKLQRITHEH